MNIRKHSQLIVSLALALVVFLSACGTNTPAIVDTPNPLSSDTPAAQQSIPATSTLDPCAPENIEAEVMKVHKIMREFDDASSLASSRPREEYADAISDLQRIRREAEDQVIAYCLGDLKTYQISHMNTVINTLLVFMRATDPRSIDCVDIVSNTEEAAVCQNIAFARQQHDQYTLELARVLGLTIEAATVIPAETATPATPAP